jgi:hypothetical protein
MGYDIQNRPQIYARTAGAIYLAVIVCGGLSEGLIMNALIVPGNDEATIGNILAKPDLWNLGLIANLIIPLIAVVQLWIEYMLLRPAGKGLALLFLLLNLASLSVEAVSKVFEMMVVPLASDGQDHAFASMALVGHDISFNVALVFFGAACLINGALIWKSGYLPRFVGVLMQVAGACYLVACFSALFAPAFSNLINPWILLPVLVGETSMCLWLLVMGVNVARWKEKNHAEKSALT